MSPRPPLESLRAVLSQHLQPGDTLIEVGCGPDPLAIHAAHLGAQGVLALDRSPEHVAAAARRVKAEGLSDVIRLACADFDAWPLIPATHAVCHVRSPAVFGMLPRLARAARSGVILLTQLATPCPDEFAHTLARAGLRLVRTVPGPSNTIAICEALATPSPSFQADWGAQREVAPSD